MENINNVSTGGKIKSYFTGSKSLFFLINTTFWKGIFGPFFVFIFPLIFIAILGKMLGYDQVLGGSFAVSSMAVSLASMPQAIFEFKKSSLLKRIGATPIRPSLFLLISGLYYFVAMMISVLWCILVSLLVFGPQNFTVGRVVSEIPPIVSPPQNIPTIPGIPNELFKTTKVVSMSFQEILRNVSWGEFIWAQTMGIAIGITIGLFLASIARSTVMIQTIGFTILLTSMFLAVTVLPIGLVREQDVFWYLGYVFSPFKTSTNLILESWNGSYSGVPILSSTNDMVVKQITFTPSSIFNPNQEFYYFSISSDTPIENRRMLAFTTAEKWVNLFIPFVWMALFTSLTAWKFRWNVR